MCIHADLFICTQKEKYFDPFKAQTAEYFWARNFFHITAVFKNLRVFGSVLPSVCKICQTYFSKRKLFIALDSFHGKTHFFMN